MNSNILREGTRTLSKQSRETGATVLLMEKATGSIETAWDHISVATTVQQIAGPTVEAYTEKGGSRYVLEVKDPNAVEKLLKVTKLVGGVEVKVSRHPTFNTSRCVISSSDISGVPDAVLKEQMASQGVVDVQRICKGRGNDKVGTTSVILTCEGTDFPETVKFGLLRIRTRAYYPLPLQCYNCYGYGHGKKDCKGKTRCRVCSGVHAIGDKCEAKAFCSNCRGNHQPTNRKCPTYVKEAGILKLRTDLGVSFRDARKVYNNEKKGKSYADVARTTPAVPSQQLKASNPKGKTVQKKKQKVKKPKPKSKGKGGTASSAEAGAGKKRKAAKPAVNPPASAVSKTIGREVEVVTRAEKCVGTEPLPDADTPAECLEKQLLQQQVECLTNEITLLKSKCLQFQETIYRIEKDRKALMGQLAKAGAVYTSDSESGPPLTRNKRKCTVLEGDRTGKSRKKGPGAGSILQSVPECESEAATGSDVTDG